MKPATSRQFPVSAGASHPRHVVGRLASIALVVAVGVWAGRSLLQLAEGPQAPAALSDIEDTLRKAPGFRGTEGLMEGQWIITDFPFQVSTAHCNTAQLDRQWEAAWPAVPRRAATADDELWRRFARKLGAEVIEDGDGETLTLKTSDMRCAVRFLQRDGGYSLAGLRIAIPQPANTPWLFIQLHAMDGRIAADSGLLPPTPRARVLARRFNRDGQPDGEVLLSSVRLQEMTALLENDGWRPVYRASPATPITVLRRRHSERLSLWAWEPATSEERLVIITREP